MPQTQRKKNGADIEYFEDIATIDEKAQEFVKLLRKSKHVIVHTGAGVSTSSGIPDFRGPNGVWTLQDLGMSVFDNNSQRNQISNDSNNNTDNNHSNTNNVPGYLDVLPTPTHMALAAWYRSGILKHLITQNVDGLHLRSGIDRCHLSELHGNVCLERCPSCHTEYLRTFDAAEDADDHHFTPRRCTAFLSSSSLNSSSLSSSSSSTSSNSSLIDHDSISKENQMCSSYLQDSIVDFGEDLPEHDLQEAERHARKADLALVLGTSLQVTPACNLPQLTLENGGRVVVVNLQKTYIDKKCSIRVFGKCDDFMFRVMKYLEMDIPGIKIPYNFVIVREIEKLENNDNDNDDSLYAWCINIEGEARRSLGIFKEIKFTVPSSSLPIESTRNRNQLKTTKRGRKKRTRTQSNKNNRYHPYHSNNPTDENNSRVIQLTQQPFAVMRKSTLPILLELECHFQPFINQPPFHCGYRLGPDTKELTTISCSLSIPSIPSSSSSSSSSSRSTN